jgi:nitrite reductase/ring-hydroxylating ferredoxin subunit
MSSGSCPSRRQFVACLFGSLAFGAVTSAWSDLPVRLIDGRGASGERRYPIPTADSVNIDHAGQVIIVRANGHVFAFSLACPHENAAVKWVEKDHRFQCTKHDSRYQPDGTHISGRATRNLDRFPVREEGAELVVSTDTTFHSDLNPQGWAGAEVDVHPLLSNVAPASTETA